MSQTAQQISLSRTIHAFPAQVYAAFTTPEGWVSWCSETAAAEAVVGGKLHIYTQGYNAYGEWRSVNAVDRVFQVTEME